jgi:hypothetical protein
MSPKRRYHSTGLHVLPLSFTLKLQSDISRHCYSWVHNSEGQLPAVSEPGSDTRVAILFKLSWHAASRTVALLPAPFWSSVMSLCDVQSNCKGLPFSLHSCLYLSQLWSKEKRDLDVSTALDRTLCVSVGNCSRQWRDDTEQMSLKFCSAMRFRKRLSI